MVRAIEETMFCTNCGAANVDEASGCPNCDGVATTSLTSLRVEMTPDQPPSLTTPSNKIVVTFDASDVDSELRSSPVIRPMPAVQDLSPSFPNQVAPSIGVPAVGPQRTGAMPSEQPLWNAPMPAAGTNGLAIGSFICGLLGISAVAIVLGFIARNQIARSGHREGGSGLALAGIILGFIWVGISIVIFVALVAVANHANSQYPN
jgi:hypothetical protein